MEGLENLSANKEYRVDAAERMKLFHEALADTIPYLQRTENKWTTLGENDDFFSLAEAMFKLTVVSKFEAVAEHLNVEMKPFANYGYYYKSLTGLNYIEVVSPDYPNSILAFNYVGSKNKPLDILYCHRLDAQEKILDRDLEVNFETASFNFRYR